MDARQSTERSYVIYRGTGRGDRPVEVHLIAAPDAVTAAVRRMVTPAVVTSQFATAPITPISPDRHETESLGAPPVMDTSLATARSSCSSDSAGVIS